MKRGIVPFEIHLKRGSDLIRARYFTIILLIFIMFSQTAKTVYAKKVDAPISCEERLKLLEPSEPKTIYDYEIFPDRDITNFKEKTYPISLIQKKGTTIPFYTVYKDLNWKRPVYSPFWHSSSWRWSYVPTNMAFQRHSLFQYQGGLSWLYDLSNYLTLPPEAIVPSPLNKFAFTIKYPYIVRLFVFNFEISSIKHYGNQIVVTGEPQRTRLTVLDFDTKDFNVIKDSKILLQLATPDGYEIDYLIMKLNTL